MNSTVSLSKSDIDVLRSLSESGDRYSYWAFLSLRGDAYATLSLQVVTNESLAGYVANNFMEFVARDKGRFIDTSTRWDIGADLVRGDFTARESAFNRGDLRNGIALDVRALYGYHLNTFKTFGLGESNQAWTMAILVRDDLIAGRDAAAQTTLDRIISGGVFQYGAAALTVQGMIGGPQILDGVSIDPGTPVNAEAATWLTRTAAAVLNYPSSESARSINAIAGYQRDPATGTWTKELVFTLDAPSLQYPADPTTAAKLDAERAFRIQKFGPNVVSERDTLSSDQRTMTATLIDQHGAVVGETVTTRISSDLETTDRTRGCSAWRSPPPGSRRQARRSNICAGPRAQIPEMRVGS